MNAQVAESTEDSRLARRASQGDTAAFSQLFDAHFSFVRKVARTLGTPDAELDDVAQEAFVIAHRQLHRFETGRFSTWLYRITSNLVANRHRSRNIRTAFASMFGQQPVAHAPAADVMFEGAEAKAQVAQVLARMTHKKREVFALYELEGLSGEEIAERLECKVETVWSRLHYAREEFERIARKQGLA